ncbi:uncharacterized protein LOC125959760 [Anopheles darlingi]|uniref:uncharacterized protein LOC125959760 n=1 Tax=Anopheles darlingi TaxID=43151 RepID=UPI0021003674|nr:uncharacterized protein LOC125959760 [Anopheles darlingi]
MAFRLVTPLVGWGVLTLLLTTASAVVNNASQDAERREAPLVADTYGPPSASAGSLPAPVYGAPAAAHYPPPPPDVPPAAPSVQIPHKEYGVPVQSYGPPNNVNIEYGPPAPALPLPPVHKPIYHHKPQYHGPPPGHPKKSASFLEQLFSTFGFGGGSSDEGHHGHHGPPPPPHSYHHAPKPVYGPPSGHIAPSYGPPAPAPVAPKPFYGPPAPQYGPPSLAAPAPRPVYAAPPPKPSYGPPLVHSGFSVVQSGGHSFNHHHHHQSPVHAPPTPPEIKCDGWKPIAGPVVQPEVHAPESSYGPPPSGDFLGGGHQGHVSTIIESAAQDIGLQLPKLEHGPVFNSHLESLGAPLAGLELPKENSYEIHSNAISDSYSVPPSDSFAPGNGYKPSFTKPLPPPPVQQPPKLHYGPPPAHHFGPASVRHPGLGISHGSISGNLKPWPVPGSPPRHPIAYRPPVPQGLIESIGHAVEHEENFGTKPAYSGDIYLPPPTRDATHGGSLELNSLPSEQPAKPFLTQHQLPEAHALIQEPRYQSGAHDIVSGVANDCGHGPTSTVDVQPSIQTNQLSIVGPSAGGSYSADYSNSLEGHYSASASESTGQHVQTSNLPGLDAGIGGLQLISAQKSQSLTIPVHGQHGSYQLQFQGAGSAPHEQILSEGLLQSILSAIEQPQHQDQHQQQQQQQDSYDPNIDHSEVSVFLKSPEGQKTLQDHPNGHTGHTL